MSGTPPLGRLFVGLAMIIAGLGTVSLATVETAAAATKDRPTAIGVNSAGTSYVGFATGGRLQVLSARGGHRSTIKLDSDEPVDGIFVTKDDEIWVDFETGFSLYSARGRLIRHHDHKPMRSCGSNAPAHRYGGITSAGGEVYIANRCHPSISVYKRNGTLIRTVKLPGNDFPRGITYGNPQAGRPATLYVAIPDRGQVLAYKVKGLRGSSRPADTFRMPRPGGGKKPEPAGLAVDRWGQLTVSDTANNALYLFDTNHDYSHYRTLGHPPRASRQAGRLNGPSAIAQHYQDGGRMSGDLWIADTNNHRVQHWNTSGYTFWSKGVRAGSGGGGSSAGGGGGGGGSGGGTVDPPTNTVLPSITGTAVVGEALTCDRGSWSGGGSGLFDSINYSYRWTRDGSTIPLASSWAYTIVAADDGAELACTVRATNGSGTAEATSRAVTVYGGGGGPGGTAPVNTVAPTVSGTAAVGQSLACSTGIWTGAGNSYSFQWRRVGVAIASATFSTYTVVGADSGQALSCVVRAFNASGSTDAVSASVTVGGGGVGGAPVNVVAPTISGTAAVGQALTCSPGAWTGSVISYGFQWQRAGAPIGSATSPTYAVAGGDSGQALSCVVRASNSSGGTNAVSPSVTVGGGGGGTAPVNLVPPTISGTAAVGQVLTCNPGTWSWSGVGITDGYQWQRAGVPIGSATSSTYTVVGGDSGQALSCVVRATDSAGSTEAVSASVTVGGSGGSGAPVNVMRPTISGTAAVGQVLTCNPGTWSWSGVGISYGYQWQRAGVPIGSATSSTYTVVGGDSGQALSCVVRATDFFGSADAVSVPILSG